MKPGNGVVGRVVPTSRALDRAHRSKNQSSFTAAESTTQSIVPRMIMKATLK